MAINSRPSGTPDYFLKLDGIKGESHDANHKDEIQVESWSFGLTQAVSFAYGSGGGAGKAAFEDLECMAKANCSSPALFVAAATGQHIPKATLTCRKSGGKMEDYYVFTFTDVLVSKYRSIGPDGSPTTRDIQPYDEFALAFSKIEISYKTQSSSGGSGAAIKGGYDLSRNVKV